jgi:hypothetical protein
MGRLRGFRKQSRAALFLCALRKSRSSALKKRSGPYDVGYGKPPDATKFGHRPQPKRRRRNKPEVPNIQSLLTEPVAVTRDGRPEKLHPHELMMLSLWKRTMKRELRAVKAFFKECDKAGLFDPPPQAQSSGVITCPKWMPMSMCEDLINAAGAPPWPAKLYNQIAENYADSLSTFSDWYPGARQAQEDEYKRY